MGLSTARWWLPFNMPRDICEVTGIPEREICSSCWGKRRNNGIFSLVRCQQVAEAQLERERELLVLTERNEKEA